MKDKITKFSVICVSYLILYLHCKFRNNIPNDCQDFARLLLGYFNFIGHPVGNSGQSSLQSWYSTVSDMKRMIYRWIRRLRISTIFEHSLDYSSQVEFSRFLYFRILVVLLVQKKYKSRRFLAIIKGDVLIARSDSCACLSRSLKWSIRRCRWRWQALYGRWPCSATFLKTALPQSPHTVCPTWLFYNSTHLCALYGVRTHHYAPFDNFHHCCALSCDL